MFSRVAIALMLALAVAVLYPVQIAHAFTNTESNVSGIRQGGVASWTISTQTVTKGDLLVIRVQTWSGTHFANGLFSGQVHVNGVPTDTCPDTWSVVSAQDSTGYQGSYAFNGFAGTEYGVNEQVFYTKAACSTTGTITISMSGTAGDIDESFSEYNTDALNVYGVVFASNLVQCTDGVTFAGSLPSNFGCTSGVNLVFGNPQTFVTSAVNIPSDSLAIGIQGSSCIVTPWTNGYPPAIMTVDGLLSTSLRISQLHPACDAGGGSTVTWATFSHLWAYFATSQGTHQFQFGGNPSNMNSGSIYPLGPGGGNSFVQSYTCTVNFVTSTCGDYDLEVAVLVVIFNGNGGGGISPGGQQQVGCSFNPIANGSTHFVSLTGNQTWFYYGQSGVSQLFFNMTVYVHAIAVTTNRHLTLALYTAPNTNPITVSNPLALATSLVFNLPTSAGAQKFSWAPNFALPTSGQYAYAVSADHGGVTLFQGNTGLNLYEDSVDGYAPAKINAIPTSSTPTVCMFGVVAIPTVTTVVSGGSGGTVTTTQTTTVASANMNPTVNLNNLMLGIIILLGPSLLIATVTHSLWGGILGAVLGLSVGVYAGFLPLWTVGVVMLTVVAALFFARQSQGGGGI